MHGRPRGRRLLFTRTLVEVTERTTADLEPLLSVVRTSSIADLGTLRYLGWRADSSGNPDARDCWYACESHRERLPGDRNHLVSSRLQFFMAGLFMTSSTMPFTLTVSPILSLSNFSSALRGKMHNTAPSEAGPTHS